MRDILDLYIKRTEEIIDALSVLTKTDSVFESVHKLVCDMQNEALSCKDDMLYPTLYNAAATIGTAPEGCSARQLLEALCDAKNEMEIMKEYM